MSFSSKNFYISIISSLIREIFGGVFLNFQKVVFLFIFLLLISKLHCGWRMSFFGTDSLKFRFAVAWYMINFCVFEKNLCSLCVWEESVFFNCQVWWSSFFIMLFTSSISSLISFLSAVSYWERCFKIHRFVTFPCNSIKFCFI